MSYQSRRPSLYLAPRLSAAPLSGVGSIFGIFGALFEGAADGSVSDECRASAETSPIIVQRQVQIDDLANNWNPTGFYTVNQLAQAVSFTFALTSSTSAALRAALQRLTAPEHVDLLNQAANELDKSIGVGGFGVDPIGPYSAVIESARASGKTVIEAQGFKRTVLSVMRATRDAAKTLVMVDCARQAALIGLLESANSAMNTLYDFLRTVVGVVASIAKNVAKIPDTLGTIFSVLKWSMLVGGTYYIGVKSGVLPEKFDPLNLRK